MNKTSTAVAATLGVIVGAAAGFYAARSHFNALTLAYYGTGEAYGVNGKWVECVRGPDIHPAAPLVRMPQHDKDCQEWITVPAQ